MRGNLVEQKDEQVEALALSTREQMPRKIHAIVKVKNPFNNIEHIFWCSTFPARLQNIVILGEARNLVV